MTAVEPIQAAPASVALPRSERGVDPAGGPRRIRVGIIGATGYVGGELVRLLARHPNVELVGLVGREPRPRSDRLDPPAPGDAPT